MPNRTSPSPKKRPWPSNSRWLLTGLSVFALSQPLYAAEPFSAVQPASAAIPCCPPSYRCSPYGQPVPQAYGDGQMGQPGTQGQPQVDGQAPVDGQQPDAGQQQADQFDFNQAAGEPDFGSLASSTSTPSSPLSSAPNMIGDFFGGGCSGESYVGGGSSPVFAVYRNALVSSTGGPLPFRIEHNGGSGLPGLNSVITTPVGPGYTFGVLSAPSGLADAVESELGYGADTVTFASDSGTGVLVPTLPSPGTYPESAGATTTDPNLSFPATGSPSSYADVSFEGTYLSPSYYVCIPSPGTSAVGRVKLAENTSPVPRDRVFFNYSYFDNVNLSSQGVNVNRYVPGFEKTFLDGMMSIEARFPLASTLDSNITADGLTSDNNTEFGNITAAWKTVLTVQDNWLLSGGVQVTAPTADDVNVGLSDGTDLVSIENESIHVMPFLGFLWLPSERVYFQGFYQIDVDTNGNPVYVNNGSPSGLSYAGRSQDVTFMYVDVGVGYWAYRNEGGRGLTGISPTFELHYNRSLQEADVIESGAFAVGSPGDNIEVLNAVVGSSFWFNDRTSLTAGYATPIGGGSDKEFDGELRLIFNHFWGASGPFARSQF